MHMKSLITFQRFQPISLAVIATILLIATIASLIKSKQSPEMKAHPGRITDHKEEDSK